MTFDLFPRNLVISVKPLYASKILSGEKSIELRRRFPAGTTVGTRAYIYATAPTKAMVGWASIRSVTNRPITEIWELFGKPACIDEPAFLRYFRNCDAGYAIELSKPYRLPNPVNSLSLRLHLGFTPPQSYRYADEDLRNFIDTEGCSEPQLEYSSLLG